MSSSRPLGRRLILSMGLGGVIGVVATFFGFYLYYGLIYYLWPNAPDSDTWYPSGTDLLFLALTTLLVLSLGVLLALPLARSIIAPVSSVAQAARRIAEGDLAARAHADARSPEETARLVHDFNAMAERLERAAGDIVVWNATIAHELRTPLTVLQGRLQGLVDGVFQPDQAQFERLLRQVESLTRLVEDLRVVSLVESGRLDLQIREVNLAAEIEDLLELVGPGLAAAGFTLATTLPAGYARLDMMRVRQALLALIDNARRYADPGELRVALEIGEADVVISVIDAGPGLPHDFARDAFTLFARAENAREEGHDGSGLGLAVVQAIARAHGGGVSYVFAPGSSAFIVRLPRYPAVTPAAHRGDRGSGR